jgi:hypothetical protein
MVGLFPTRLNCQLPNLKITKVPEMMENTKALFRPNEHVWIMTEDPNPDSFFADMKSSYQVNTLTVSSTHHTTAFKNYYIGQTLALIKWRVINGPQTL